MAIAHPASPPPLLSIPLFLHLLHLPLVGSPSAHHCTQQINCRVKLRLAKQGDGSGASGTNSKRKRERESRWVICHRVNGVTTLSIDLSEWALKLYHFRGAVELDWAWKLESNFTPQKNKSLSWLEQSLRCEKNSIEFFNHFSAYFWPSLANPKSACSCFIWGNNMKYQCRHGGEDLKQFHFNWD